MPEPDDKLDSAQAETIVLLLKRYMVHTGTKPKRMAATLKEDYNAFKDIAGRKNSKKPPSKRLAMVFLAVCKADETFQLTIDDERKLGFLWDDTVPSPEADRPKESIREDPHPIVAEPQSIRAKETERVEAEPHLNRHATDTFMAALGLTQTIADLSKQMFNGRYLLFSLNRRLDVVTTKYHLLDKLGQDGAPTLETSRNYPSGDVTSLGTYFCRPGEYSNLYLLASPPKTVDLRLSIFDVVIRKKRQAIVRGQTLLVTRENSIFSTRSVLVPADLNSEDTETRFTSEDVQNQLWEAPMTVGSFEEFGADAKEISDFLLGKESDEPAKAAFLILPSSDERQGHS